MKGKVSTLFILASLISFLLSIRGEIDSLRFDLSTFYGKTFAQKEEVVRETFKDYPSYRETVRVLDRMCRERGSGEGCEGMEVVEGFRANAWSIAAVSFILFTGYLFILFIESLSSGGRKVPLILRLSTAFPLGAGTLSFATLLLNGWGFESQAPLLLLPALILIFLLLRKGSGWGAPWKEIRFAPPGPSHLLLLPAIMVTAASILLSLIKPASSWDAWAIWTFRAKEVFLQGGFTKGVFSISRTLHPDYPPLIPLLEVFMMRSRGSMMSTGFLLPFPLFLISLYGGIYGFLEIKERGGLRARALLVLLSGAYTVILHSHNGYADIPLSAFILLSAAYLLLFRERREGRFLILSILFASFAALTKNEGVSFLLFIIPPMLLSILRGGKGYSGRGKRALQGTAVLLIPALVYLPWALILSKHGVQNDIIANLTLTSSYFLERLGRLPFILTSWVETGARTGEWGLFWFTFLAALIIGFRRIPEGEAGLLTWLFFSQVSVYTLVYLVSYTLPVIHIPLSMNRLLIHHTGTASILMALLLKREGRPLPETRISIS